MKNKVLRLAIIAVLVVAMVLSMAACGPKVPPVDPTPSPTPVVTPTPTPTVTKTPDKTPEVGSGEAALESKYGITFPVPDGMKFDYVPTPTTTPTPADHQTDVVRDSKGNIVSFGAKAPAYNDAFNAYGQFISVSAKVTGLTKEGGKIEIDLAEGAKADGFESTQKFAPKAAGTYTVTYTVKISYAPEAGIGYFQPSKISETYTVVKTYEVAKKSITIESVSDVAEKTSKLEFKPYTINYGSKNAAEVEKIKAELKIGGTDAKYNLAANILGVDTTSYGAYPMNLVCTIEGKSEVVDVATLVAPNYEVTFKNGSRYILTETEIAAVTAAIDDVAAAAAATANKEAIALGVATFTALSDGAKVKFTAANAGNYGKMMDNQENLAKVGMVEEAKKLIKVWNDKLQNAEDAKAFVAYMVGLSKADYTHVAEQIKTETAALKLVADYRAAILDAFVAEVGKLETAFAGIGDTFNEAIIDSIVKQLEKVQTKFDTLLADQKSAVPTQAGTLYDTSLTWAVIMAKANALVNELSVRYDAYATLIADLDAYTDAKKVTNTAMTSLLGYAFDTKAVNNKTPEKNSASYVLFNTIDKGSMKTDAFVKFRTPMIFVADATASYKKVVDAYVALDAAIVEAQVNVMSTLGSKLADAGDASKKVQSFNGTQFVRVDNVDDTDTSLMYKYEALQIYLGDQILANVYTAEKNVALGDAIHFEALAKKELAEVIAAALKDPVSTMNSWIKDWVVNGDTTNQDTPTLP